MLQVQEVQGMGMQVLQPSTVVALAADHGSSVQTVDSGFGQGPYLGRAAKILQPAPSTSSFAQSWQYLCGPHCMLRRTCLLAGEHVEFHSILERQQTSNVT